MNENKKEILRMEHIGKSFPGVRALSDVGLTVEKGSVHALIGENGAGKSTLIKVLMGVYGSQYEGEIYIDSEKVQIKDPIQAKEKGMLAIYQDITMAPHLTVGENFYLGKLPGRGMAVDWKSIYEETEKILRELNIDINPRSRVMDLTVAQQEMVSIAKALSEKPKIVVFDEPTALLADEDTQMLFSIIRTMQKKGIGIIYISHRMEELFEICDKATVLKDGQYVATVSIADTNQEKLVALMVGRGVSDMYGIKHGQIGREIMRVEALTKTGTFKNISFNLHKGEILGLFGLVGSGRTDVVRSIFGADKYDSGEIWVHGKKVSIKSPNDAISQGIGLLPEDRRLQGLCLGLDCVVNINLASYDKCSRFGNIFPKKEMDTAKEYIQKVGVKTPSPRQKIRNLSGGNQQKVVIGKWLCRNSDIFIFDEPTVGIDVNAKREIYKMLEELVSQGNSIILISSYLPEILGLADRIVVFHEGTIHGRLFRSEIEMMKDDEREKTVLLMASGLNGNENMA